MQVTIGEAITEYERELRSLGRSESTIRVYLIYLHQFAQTCGVQASVKAAASPARVTAYFATCRSQHTRNGSLAALRGFLAWAVRMRYLPAASAEIALQGRQTRKVERQPKHYVDVADFPRLLDCAGESHPIERAVIALALYTLCRQSEIIGLRLQDVDLANRKLRVYRNKRKRWTEVTISPDLHAELIEWLEWYADHTETWMVDTMMSTHPDWHLIPHWAYIKVRDEKGGAFTGTNGDAVITPDASPRRLEGVLKRALTKLGVKTRNGDSVKHLGEGIHTIRRSGARALLDHLEGAVGADRALLMVSAMLDHDDTQMTLRYIGKHIDKERLDDYLRGHSMYGDLSGGSSDASVIMMPTRERVPNDVP